MNKEEHIEELVKYLMGWSICMCPESRKYWRNHYREVRSALKGADNERHNINAE